MYWHYSTVFSRYICDYGNTVLPTHLPAQEVGVAKFPGALDYKCCPLTPQLLSYVCRGEVWVHDGQRYRGQASDDLGYLQVHEQLI